MLHAVISVPHSTLGSHVYPKTIHETGGRERMGIFDNTLLYLVEASHAVTQSRIRKA